MPRAMGASPPHISSLAAGKSQNASLPMILGGGLRQRGHASLSKCISTSVIFCSIGIPFMIPQTFRHRAPCICTIGPTMHFWIGTCAAASSPNIPSCFTMRCATRHGAAMTLAQRSGP
uniref:Uncharacterized protein n=1 Tax=Noctiluca scintillans TaxID=2966 RepID=A0A7S1AR35_NOCSC